MKFQEPKIVFVNLDLIDTAQASGEDYENCKATYCGSTVVLCQSLLDTSHPTESFQRNSNSIDDFSSSEVSSSEFDFTGTLW